MSPEALVKVVGAGIIVASLLFIFIVHLPNEKGFPKPGSYLSTCRRKEAPVDGCAIKHFQNVLLVLTFNSPFYQNFPILHEMYGSVFGKIVTSGTDPPDSKIHPDIILEHRKGFHGYECMGRAIDAYPGYKGYLYGNDDMIINWWSLLAYDKNKIWRGSTHVDFRQEPNKDIVSYWNWWNTEWGLKACAAYYQDLQDRASKPQVDEFNATSALKTASVNGGGKLRCAVSYSDLFYIPKQHTQTFRFLSNIAFTNHLFLEIAVNNILASLDFLDMIEVLNGVYLPERVGNDISSKTFWSIYRRNYTFLHPFKMGTSDFNKSILDKQVISYKLSLCEGE